MDFQFRVYYLVEICFDKYYMLDVIILLLFEISWACLDCVYCLFDKECKIMKARYQKYQLSLYMWSPLTSNLLLHTTGLNYHHALYNHTHNTRRYLKPNHDSCLLLLVLTHVCCLCLILLYPVCTLPVLMLIYFFIILICLYLSITLNKSIYHNCHCLPHLTVLHG